MNIGARPTFTSTRALEVHVLAGAPDLYERKLTVHFHARLRDTRRFGTVDELVQQIGEDIARAGSILAGGPTSPFPDALP